jgi:hypothetical protein
MFKRNYLESVYKLTRVSFIKSVDNLPQRSHERSE